MERARARIDLSAVERNCARLAATVADRVDLCAVVKADGYGHGAVACAGAAIAGGARALAVATSGEAAELGPLFPQSRLLTMGALSPEELDTALSAGSEIGLWHQEFRSLAAARARALGQGPAKVHVKHDSGMGRLGNRDPHAVLQIARSCAEDPDLELVGLWTHFATADVPDSDYFDEQLSRFSELVAAVRAEFPEITVHAANSAAVLREAASHFDMVRCGVAIYGLDPFQGDPANHGLAPALSLSSYVADVKRLAAGDSVGYGQTWKAGSETRVAVLPIGYGDGVRRALSNNAEVLIRGRRYPVVGTVSMDNLTVDVGPEAAVEAGDEAVLIGTQSGEAILAEEVASRIGTINYEVTCGISARVPRVFA